MKKFLTLLVCAAMILSMVAVTALPAFADEDEEEEKIDPNEWMANYIQSVDGDWLTRRGSGDIGKVDSFKPAGGYYYDSEGFHTISPDYTNMTPYYAVVSKETYNLKDGFNMIFRVDDFAYKGENGQADEWVAITISDNQLLSPGSQAHGNGSGWIALNRGAGDGNVSTESCWSVEKDEEGQGGVWAYQGATPTTAPIDDGKEYYSLDVSWDGSDYTIRVNDVVIAGNSTISKNLDGLNSDGDFYIGIVFSSTARNGTAALTITDVNGSTPTGNDNVPAEEYSREFGAMVDSSTVPVNQPALLWDANRLSYASLPSMSGCEIAPNADGTFTVTPSTTNSNFWWHVRTSMTYSADDFPMFGMLVKNFYGNGSMCVMSGENLSYSHECIVGWGLDGYEDYETEWEDSEGYYWDLVMVNMKEVEFPFTGRIHGIRIDFAGMDASGEETFDIMYMGFFRSADECTAYATEYMIKAGVIDGTETGEASTGDVATDPATDAATDEATDAATDAATDVATGDATTAETKADATDAATAAAEEEGCSSVIGAGAAALVLSAMAAAVALKKKH